MCAMASVYYISCSKTKKKYVMSYNLTRNYDLLGTYIYAYTHITHINTHAQARTQTMEKCYNTRPFRVVICCVEPIEVQYYS